MKKYVLDLKVVSVEALSDKHVLIKLTDEKPLPEILPGQFVEVKVDHSPATMLRRPISINFVDRETNQLWLLVAMVGDGTRQLGKLQAGDTLNCMLPLGNGFTMPTEKSQKYLLVGGGVGVAGTGASAAGMGGSHGGIGGAGGVVEPPLDFGGSEGSDAPTSPSLFDHPQTHGVKRTPKNIANAAVKYVDKPQRKITEIRIFYDDQTWETFVPKK